MLKSTEELTTVEKKVAYALGFPTGNQTFVEALIACWQARVALMRLRLSKAPLFVLLRVV
jgi:ABC-type transport system involved in cytochrome c biogenesis ATPase subunit